MTSVKSWSEDNHWFEKLKGKQGGEWQEVRFERQVESDHVGLGRPW